MRKVLLLISLIALTFGFATAQESVDSLTHDGIKRAYRLFLPSSYSSTANMPVVINHHGLTSNAQQQRFYSGMNTTASSNNFIVVYPDGISNAWNSGFPGAPYYGGVDDVGFINALIDTLNSLYSINLDRVYSCGMSNGGFQSYRLACELDTRIAAIASVTGSMADSVEFYCNHTRPVPVMQVHGTEDPTVDYDGIANVYPGQDDLIDYWVNYNNCDATPTIENFPDVNTTDGSTVASYHYTNGDNGSDVLFYKVTDGGHTWPGSGIILPETNQDINCSQHIWDFFNQYDINGRIAAATAIDEVKSFDVQVSPNPFVNEINIKTDLQNVFEVKVVDVLGNTVYTQHSTAANTSLNLDDLSKGIYFIKIADKTVRVLKK